MKIYNVVQKQENQIKSLAQLILDKLKFFKKNAKRQIMLNPVNKKCTVWGLFLKKE